MKVKPEGTIEFMRRFLNDRLEGILIGAVCRIEKYDATRMTADVQPMIRQEKPDGKTVDLPLLVNIRVGYQGAGDYIVRPPYKKGELVWVSFATYDIYPGLSGKKADAEGGLFSLQNACVMCSVEQTGMILPISISSKEGLLFAHKDGGAIQQLLSNKVVYHFGSQKTTIDASGVTTTGGLNADQEITAMASTAAVSLSTHTHSYVDTPVGPSVTGAPVPG